MLTWLTDNWLHAATESISIIHYEQSTSYTENKNQNNSDPELYSSYQAGFTTGDGCLDPRAPLPCSLIKTGNFTNLAYPSSVYLTLGTGISQISSGFNGINSTNEEDQEDKNTATPYQVVTYSKDGVSHSLLFTPDAAAENDNTSLGYTHIGIDYVAKSISMATQCTFVTKDCGIHQGTTNTSDVDIISIPFHCYDDFSGDLGQTPSTGHERAQGWNMSFYQLVNGTPTNIAIQAQSNPFNFYVATAVNSIDLAGFDGDESGLPEGDPNNGSLIDAGNGFTAFALKCEATIYDVTFSIINGSFHDFNTTISSPQIANIVQAPLQVGFGQYHLYGAASTAVLVSNTSVASSMAQAFSQTGMALASGAFDFDNNVLQRFRWTLLVTMVPKAPFFYLVAVCLVYSAFGIVMTLLALHLRRSPEVRDQQARLMVEWGSELEEMDRREEEEDEKALRRRRNEDAPGQRDSSDFLDVIGAES